VFDAHAFMREVHLLHRTLVSRDTRHTLERVGELLPGPLAHHYRIVEIPTGTPCWTWRVPPAYEVERAILRDPNGRVVADFHVHPLHLVSYSQPLRARLSWQELAPHLHTNPRRPHDLPWKFSFYEPNWGFCLAHAVWENLPREGIYEVEIESSLEEGHLSIGELFLPGELEEEFLVVTNVCHPGQVNDSITGVAAMLAILQSERFAQTSRLLGLRLLFLPETIGSIAYFATRASLPPIVGALFTEMLACSNSLALQRSWQGNSWIDLLAESCLLDSGRPFRCGAFRTIVGNDELVTNGPGLGIPTVSISRSARTGDSFPEYHTSADDPQHLEMELFAEAVEYLGTLLARALRNYRPALRQPGPVFLSGHGLWGAWGDLPAGKELTDRLMLGMDGSLRINQLADRLALPFERALELVERFRSAGLVQAQGMRAWTR